MTIDLEIGRTPVQFSGIVVRTWTAPGDGLPHSGVQFDPMPVATTRLLNRFLVEQLGADDPGLR